MERSSKKILIVEDDEALVEALIGVLGVAGYETDWAPDGNRLRERIGARPPDLVLLDIGLPGGDGFELLREIRAIEDRIGVLVLTGRFEETEKVRGFSLGADDWVVKPVGSMELLARIGAILKRTAAPPGEGPTMGSFEFGDVQVSPSRRRVVRAGREVALAPMEFDLLCHLAEAEGEVVSRETLLSEVWGYGSPVETRTVDTHVARLRAKLEVDSAAPEHLLTASRAGYRLKGVRRLPDELSD